MGYAHHFSHMPEAPEFRAIWPQLRDDTIAILNRCDAVGVPIKGPMAFGPPHVSGNVIAFNGPSDRSRDPLYVSTWPEPDPDYASRPDPEARFVWSYVQTDRHPYDLAVTTVLLRARLLAPRHIAIGGDGSWECDWTPARQLVTELFGPIPEDNPLGETRDGPDAVADSAN